MNDEINKLKLEIEELKNKNNELEEKLKSYTNPERNKKYYEKNSDIVKKQIQFMNFMEIIGMEIQKCLNLMKKHILEKHLKNYIKKQYKKKY